MSSDEIQIAELRGRAFFYLIERTEHGDRMWVELQGSFPAPTHIGNFALCDRRVTFGLVDKRWGTRAHDIGVPHGALKVTGEHVGLVALSLQVRLGPVTLGAERLELLLPEAFGKSLDVAPLERRALPVAEGATVGVLRAARPWLRR
jgi:hypothetical protein